MFLLKFNAIEVYQKKKKNQWIQNGEKEDEEEEDEEVGWDAGFIHAGPLLFFLSFFFFLFLITGQILYRPKFTSRLKLAEIVRNDRNGPKQPEI